MCCPFSQRKSIWPAPEIESRTSARESRFLFSTDFQRIKTPAVPPHFRPGEGAVTRAITTPQRKANQMTFLGRS